MFQSGKQVKAERFNSYYEIKHNQSYLIQIKEIPIDRVVA